MQHFHYLIRVPEFISGHWLSIISSIISCPNYNTIYYDCLSIYSGEKTTNRNYIMKWNNIIQQQKGCNPLNYISGHSNIILQKVLLKEGSVLKAIFGQKVELGAKDSITSGIIIAWYIVWHEKTIIPSYELRILYCMDNIKATKAFSNILVSKTLKVLGFVVPILNLSIKDIF